MNMTIKSFAGAGAVVGAAVLALVDPALAQEAEAAAEAAAPGLDVSGVPAETGYILNTLSFFIHGALVMWMAAGFAMLESGLVRTKNTAAICLKNIALYSIAGIMYYLIGYDLMYTGVDGGYIGSFSLFYNPAEVEMALLEAASAVGDANDAIGALAEDAAADAIAAANSALAESEAAYSAAVVAANEVGYSQMSDWFFQMVFVATAASIVSGTLAERIKFWPFMIFVVVLTGILYPIQGSWTWGAGWLSEAGFSDFAGSTIVHSVGGWAALVGAIILGARKGKYNADGSINPMPGANLPLATLGTFILWLGWFGFNGGSQLALGSAADAAWIAIVYTNTNLAAAAGVVAAMILCQILYGKIDLTMALNGAIAGLVSITAGPDLTNHFMSIIVGVIGGVLVVVAVPLLDKLKIDDVVGAVSAHLVAGIWGTLAVGIFGSGDLVTQVIGIAAIGAFMIVTSGVVWFILKATVGLRVSEEEEEMGLDRYELGLEAYPEFGQGSQRV